MKTELKEIILIARAIVIENEDSQRLKSQCKRIEDLCYIVDSNNYCKGKNDFSKCSTFLESPSGCTMCQLFIIPSKEEK